MTLPPRPTPALRARPPPNSRACAGRSGHPRTPSACFRGFSPSQNQRHFGSDRTQVPPHARALASSHMTHGANTSCVLVLCTPLRAPVLSDSPGTPWQWGAVAAPHHREACYLAAPLFSSALPLLHGPLPPAISKSPSTLLTTASGQAPSSGTPTSRLCHRGRPRHPRAVLSARGVAGQGLRGLASPLSAGGGGPDGLRARGRELEPHVVSSAVCPRHRRLGHAPKCTNNLALIPYTEQATAPHCHCPTGRSLPTPASGRDPWRRHNMLGGGRGG